MEINGVLVVWSDGEYVNLVAILHLECGKLRSVIVVCRKIQAQHRALFMRFEPLNFDVLQSCGRQYASSKLQHFLY